MTGLHRTPLTTSQKIECVAKALAGQEDSGGMAGLSRDYGVSRPTVYAAKVAASEVLREHCEEPESDPTVWVKVDKAQLRRTVVALHVMAPNALRPLEDRVPIVYPGVRIFYGKVQSMAAEAEAQAAAFNAKAGLSGARAGALDEMFSQGGTGPCWCGSRQRILVWFVVASDTRVSRTGPTCSLRARPKD